MRSLLVAAAALALSAPAWALYKVIGPDGKVTYTDRPPIAESASRIAPFRPGHSAAADPGLPFELREVAQRYPVTLYTGTECVPCDSARQLLQQRGVPYSERRVTTEADARLFDQLGAGRMLPGLSVGTQQLRGLNTSEWSSYLDAAGYPKESRLPKGWKPPVATPLAETRPPSGTGAATAATATTDPADASAPRRAAPAAPPAPAPISAPPSPPAGTPTLRF